MDSSAFLVGSIRLAIPEADLDFAGDFEVGPEGGRGRFHLGIGDLDFDVDFPPLLEPSAAQDVDFFV